jgi:hypothetical protein
MLKELLAPLQDEYGQLPEAAQDKIDELFDYLEEIRKCLLIMKRNEFLFEEVPQITIKVVMLLLIRSISSTHSGLEVAFRENFDWVGFNFSQVFLILSILWSLKTATWTYVKIKADKKIKLVSLTSKCILSFRALLGLLMRTGCLVAYFCPALGLADLLAHWRAEQLALDPSFRKTFFDDDPSFLDIDMDSAVLSYWDNNANVIKSVTFRELFRSNYSSKYTSPPDYSEYTFFTLQSYYLLFWLLILTQFCLIMILKLVFSEGFQHASWTTRIQHVSRTLHLPDCFDDWDAGNDGPRDHRIRWWSNIKEVVAMAWLHLQFNLLLLLPVVGTGKNDSLRKMCPFFKNVKKLAIILSKKTWNHARILTLVN